MKNWDMKTFDQLTESHKVEAEKSMRHCGCSEAEIKKAKQSKKPIFSVFNKNKKEFRGFLMTGII